MAVAVSTSLKTSKYLTVRTNNLISNVPPWTRVCTHFGTQKWTLVKNCPSQRTDKIKLWFSQSSSTMYSDLQKWKFFGPAEGFWVFSNFLVNQLAQLWENAWLSLGPDSQPSPHTERWACNSWHPWWVVRCDLCAKAGRKRCALFTSPRNGLRKICRRSYVHIWPGEV